MTNHAEKSNADAGSAAALSVLIGLLVITAAVTALGCAWSGTWHSVRFNDYQTEREMGRLPPLPSMPGGMNAKRAAWDSETEAGYYDYQDYSSSEDGSKKVDAMWERAESAEQDGNLNLSRSLLTEYLKLGESTSRRNSASDRLDALTALNQGASAAAVKTYLDARRLHDGKSPDANEIERLLQTIQADKNLKDNAAYLRAAELYRQNEFGKAAAAFKDVTVQNPNSEKREAALFMTAVATMKTSVTYIPESGNSDYDQPGAIKNTDQAWQDAFAAFQRVVDEYPRGKYFNDARGWQAYLHLRRRDRAAAMAQYYRLLADPRDEVARRLAVVSLSMIRCFATEDEIGRVEKQLANEPQAALAYAYHNIYNYSIDPGSQYPPPSNDNDSNSSGASDYNSEFRRSEAREREWQDKRRDVGRKELLRTLEFSKQLLSNYPNLAVGGGFALRAAQASKELDDNESAVQFAQRALRSGLQTEMRAEALWTLGIAEQRLGNTTEARKSLNQLLHDYPNGPLTEETRRALAMVAEDAGDIDSALDQYIALKYTADEAYLVDYLMTPEQLASFIEKHQDSPRTNELMYALGIRYLRMNRWDDARKTLGHVKTTQSSNYNYYCAACGCAENPTIKCDDPKANALGAEADESGRKDIPATLLLRELQTVNDLESLERAANQARDDETRAEALYQYASYQYEGGSLLFYNPLATPGYYNLGMLAGYGRYRAPNEPQTLFNAQQEHERLARALKIFLQVATQYPKTKAARDALYTAAVCHERLANYNPYWRGIYENGLHAGDRMVTYADVTATYPNYQLPRGTFGWQPSTRTVNGGPGWAPPPPPPPQPKRLTRTERVKLYAGLVRDRLISFWFKDGKRWLTEILIVCGLLFTLRIARRNQRRLRARLARQRIQQAKELVTYPWFDWFWIEPVVPSRREQIRKFLNDKRDEFLCLARDRRGRPVLLRSLVSHSAVTALVVGLIWTIYG